MNGKGIDVKDVNQGYVLYMFNVQEKERKHL